jgi:hypothetical protein
MYEWVQQLTVRLLRPEAAISDPDSIVAAELQQHVSSLAAASIQPPSIQLTRNWLYCRRAASLNAEYLPGIHSVRVCLNLIQSEEDLAGVLARELSWMTATCKGIPASDSAVARAVLSSCQAEIARVSDLDSPSRHEAVRTCAQYYLKRKLPNTAKRQIDAWHFYTRQLVQENS